VTSQVALEDLPSLPPEGETAAPAAAATEEDGSFQCLQEEGPHPHSSVDEEDHDGADYEDQLHCA